MYSSSIIIVLSRKKTSGVPITLEICNKCVMVQLLEEGAISDQEADTSGEDDGDDE